MKSCEIVTDFVRILKPKCVVELGTSDGYGASLVMEVLPQDSTLTTINWPNPPSGDNPRKYLSKWSSDKRLRIILGDTRDRKVYNQIPSDIDLLHIDSTHTYECVNEEWSIYKHRIITGCMVIIDDLDHNDMMKFWNELDQPKTTMNKDKIGVFRYRKGV